MNKISTYLLLTITVLCLILVATRQSHAQDKSFAGIIPFVTSNDRVGFLNQTNGRIYIYDSNVSKCLFIGQIDSLGKPINVITETTSDTINQ
jgi:hypothetical protein